MDAPISTHEWKCLKTEPIIRWIETPKECSEGYEGNAIMLVIISCMRAIQYNLCLNLNHLYWINHHGCASRYTSAHTTSYTDRIHSDSQLKC